MFTNVILPLFIAFIGLGGDILILLSYPNYDNMVIGTLIFGGLMFLGGGLIALISAIRIIDGKIGK